MKNRIILLGILLLIGFLSVGVINASDLNSTDFEVALSEISQDDLSVSNNNISDKTAVFESENSNNLSNNTLSTNDDTNIQQNNNVVVNNKTYNTESEFTLASTDSDENRLSNQTPNIAIETTNSDDLKNLNNTYNGNDKHTSSNTSTTLSALKTVSSSDLKIYYKSTTKFSAKFLNSQGNILKNTNVNFTINGKSYTVKTNLKGVASLTINLKPGTYSIITYNPITGYSAKNTVKVLSTITANNISKVYKDEKKFTAKFYKSNGKVLAKKTVKFKVNGKIYNVKTNSKGVASLKLTALKKGTYKIISYNVDGLTKTNKIKVYNKVSTSLNSNYYVFLKSNKKIIKAKLLNKFGYAPEKGKIIKFKINKKTYLKKTNSKGIATLTLPSLSKGTYTVKYSFAGDSHYYKSSATNNVVVIPSKASAITFKSTSIFGQGAGTQLKVALTASKIPIAKKTVILKLNGETYTKITDKNGIVSLKIGNIAIGNYTVNYSFKGDSKLSSTSGSNTITIKERVQTKTTLKSETTIFSGFKNLNVLVVDNNSKALSGKSVSLTLNSKTYTAKTSTNGYATFSLSLSAGTFNVTTTFSGDNDYAGSTSSLKLTVKSKYRAVSIANIISSAKSLKTYYATYKKLPATVNVNGTSYTTAEFLYLMSGAIVNLGNSKSNDVTAISVSNPTYSNGDSIDSKALSKDNYINVAENVLKYIKTNKKAPNYASSSLGKIAYEELLDSFSIILDYYGTNKNLPNTVTIKYSAPSSIATLAAKLTAGLSSDKAKANVLFVWVRDNIDYSFYYNTVKGASKTLSSGTGNCCDQAQLLVALARAAGLTARFATGNCKFSSGSWYGHVWVQIKVSGSWHALDTTSSKNTYDSIKNWNTASYTNRKTYTNLPY